MNEIAKEVEKKRQGVYIDTTIGSLLSYYGWMMSSPGPPEMAAMLNITDETAGIDHVEFGQPKSNVLKVGKRGKEVPLKLGEMELAYNEKYKYLGLTQNTANNLKYQILSIKGNVGATYQIIIAITADQLFSNIEMETIWISMEMCILAFITCSGEVWMPPKNETTEINKILDNIIKRILQVPNQPQEKPYT